MINQNKIKIEKIKFILRRFMAALIDLILIVFIVITLNYVITGIWMNSYACLIVDLDKVDNIMMILSVFIIPYLFFCIAEIKDGGTIGKRIMGLYLCTKYSDKCKNSQIFLKNFINIAIFWASLFFVIYMNIDFLGIYIIPINAIFIIITNENLSVGDIVAKIRVVYDEKHYNGKIPKCINKKNIVRMSIVMLGVFIIVYIMPPRLYIEEVRENSEIYIFTKNKPMNNETIFNLIIEYDTDNVFENITDSSNLREYFPMQYEFYSIMGSSPQTLSAAQRKELPNYNFSTNMFEEVNTFTPVIVIYDYSKNSKEYRWSAETGSYQATYPLLEYK